MKRDPLVTCYYLWLQLFPKVWFGESERVRRVYGPYMYVKLKVTWTRRRSTILMPCKTSKILPAQIGPTWANEESLLINKKARWLTRSFLMIGNTQALETYPESRQNICLSNRLTCILGNMVVCYCSQPENFNDASNSEQNIHYLSVYAWFGHCIWPSRGTWYLCLHFDWPPQSIRSFGTSCDLTWKSTIKT